MKIKTIGTDLAKNIFPNHSCQLRIVFLKVIHFIASECKALLIFSVLLFALAGLVVEFGVVMLLYIVQVLASHNGPHTAHRPQHSRSHHRRPARRRHAERTADLAVFIAGAVYGVAGTEAYPDKLEYTENHKILNKIKYLQI